MFHNAQFTELGFRAASAGFHFDAIELVTALANEVEENDVLAPVLPILRYSGQHAQSELEQLRSSFRIGVTRAVRDTEGYRALLTDEIFPLVENLATLTSYAQAQEHQAAFYAGFGMGRFRSIFRGVLLFQRLMDLPGLSDTRTLGSVPTQLNDLAQEAVRQFLITRRNEDLGVVHPWLDGLLSVGPQLSDNADTLLAIASKDLQSSIHAIDEAIPGMIEALR